MPTPAIFSRFLPLILWLPWASQAEAEKPLPLPHWTWPGANRMGEDRFVYEATLPSTGHLTYARFRMTTDFARATVFINGKAVLSLEAYDPPAETDIRPYLVQGDNRIRWVAHGTRGPSAVAATLLGKYRDGTGFQLRTGPDWAGPGLGEILPQRWAANQLPDIDAFAEYNQWKEALKPGQEDRLSPLPPGFEIERIRTAQLGEDSWVSLAIDPRGRLLVAQEQRGLLRMTRSADGAKVTLVERVNETLEECRGLVWKGDALFANANNSKALYRLRDTTGDDQFDEVTLLKETGGKVGHGRNDLALGPDGMIHAIHGDSVNVPDQASFLTVSEPGAPWELGHWLRTDENAGTWEIRTRGLRNPYGIDFNPDGEAFTYDADNEGDVGLPFYRPTRINHLVSGGNYGWLQDRDNTRNLPVYAPDSVPATYDVGRGSPTAVKFASRSAFPAPYQEALFALDWAYGRILAVHLIPRGAGYHGSGEVFLEGRPLNVTDLEFDSSGAMLFITGGRRTQSALYRLRYRGEPIQPPVPGPQAAARLAFSANARQQRHQLEQYHGRVDPGAVEAAWPWLEDDDPWMRNAARIALEHQPPATWKTRALTSTNLTALLALARAGTMDDEEAVARRLIQIEREDWRRIDRLTFLRICQLIPAQSAEQPLLTAKLERWLPDLSDPVNRELCRVLTRFNSPVAIPAALDFMARADDQLERLHYLEVLSEARAGWKPESRQAYFRQLAHEQHFARGDRFMPAFFDTLKKNALAGIDSDDERTALTAILNAGAAKPGPAPRPRPFVKNWTLTDFTDADLDGAAPAEMTGRDLFAAALCSQCHMCGNLGRPLGPDLTRVASRFNRRDLLESILDPTRVVAEVHQPVIIQMRDGSFVAGRIIRNDFRQSKLHVSTNPFEPAQTMEIPKAEILSYEQSAASPMPSGLLNTLSKEEVIALLRWLETQG